jgi:GMP synthase (glutamine-hydrolysing)
MKPFLILQLREIDVVADNEYEAFLKYGGLRDADTHRIRIEKESFANIDLNNYAGVLLGGGPSNVSDELSEKPDFQRRFEAELQLLFDQLFALDIPYLGSCYGLGAVVNYAGGRVTKEKYSEKVGLTTVHFGENALSDPLLQGLPSSFQAFVGHKEACQNVPEGGVLLASSTACPVQLVRFKRNIYAAQFHVELDAEGIIVRIQNYRNHGYFEPKSAAALIKEVKNTKAEVPQQILQRFVEKYR